MSYIKIFINDLIPFTHLKRKCNWKFEREPCNLIFLSWCYTLLFKYFRNTLQKYDNLNNFIVKRSEYFCGGVSLCACAMVHVYLYFRFSILKLFFFHYKSYVDKRWFFLNINILRRLSEEELRNKSASLTRAQPVHRPPTLPGSQQSLPTAGHLRSQQYQPSTGQISKQSAEPTLLKDRIKKLQVHFENKFISKHKTK